jgi:hypothetical protein
VHVSGQEIGNLLFGFYSFAKLYIQPYYILISLGAHFDLLAARVCGLIILAYGNSLTPFGNQIRLVSEYFILCRTQDLNSCTQVHNLNECKLLMFMRYISIRIIYIHSHVPLDHAHRPSHPPILRCVR